MFDDYAQTPRMFKCFFDIYAENPNFLHKRCIMKLGSTEAVSLPHGLICSNHYDV